MTVPSARILVAGVTLCIVGALVLFGGVDRATAKSANASNVAGERNTPEGESNGSETPALQPEAPRIAAIPTSSLVAEEVERPFVRDFEPPVLYGVDVVVVDGATKARVAGAEVMALYSAKWMDCDSIYAGFITDIPLAHDYEEHLRRVSRRFRTDRNGCARIPSWSLTYVGARFGGKFAFARFEKSQCALELSPDTQIDVDVVDVADAPVEGVQMVVHHFEPGGEGFFSRETRLTRTNRDGRATLRNLEKFVDLNKVVVLRAGFPGRMLPESSTRLDVKQQLPTPIRLRIPNGRSLRVEVVDTTGKPLLRRGTIEIHGLAVPNKNLESGVRSWGSNAAGPHGQPATAFDESELKGGVATFSHGSIDCDFRAVLSISGLRSELELVTDTTTTPKEGSDVLRYRCSALVSGLQCRLIGPSNEPLVDWEVAYPYRSTSKESNDEEVRSESFSADPIMGLWCRSRANGTITAWEEDPKVEDGRMTELTVCARNGERVLFGSTTISPGTRARGETIDLPMREGDLLVRGSVRDDGGLPCPGVRVMLQIKSEDSEPLYPSGFRSVALSEIHTDLHGNFVARDLKPDGVWLATVEGPGLAGTRAVEFKPGTTIELKAVRIGVIAGKIRTGSVTPDVACRVEVHVTPLVPLADTYPIKFDPVIKPDGSFSAEVPTGTACIKVFAINDHVVPLAEVTDVRVSQRDEPKDRRLDDIDVSSTLRTIRLDVWGPNGAECDFVCWRILSGVWSPVFEVNSPSRKPIFISTEPVDLVVFAGWSRLVVLSRVHSDTKVVLAPSIEVKICAGVAPTIAPEIGRIALCLGYELDLGVLGSDANHWKDALNFPEGDGIHRTWTRGPGILRAEWAIWNQWDSLVAKIPASLNRFAVPSGVGASITFDMPTPDPATLDRVLKSLRP